MARIYRTESDWHLVIAPDARYVQDINEPAKGYRARIGEDNTGKHVVMDVHYDKSKYTIEDVMKFADKAHSCPKCAALDKEKMNIEAIELMESTPTMTSQIASTNIPVSAVATSPNQVSIQTQQQISPLKDVFANVFFDAYLTRPGKYFLGMMLNDEKILESALPKNRDELPEFMDEMVDFMSGRSDFVRSPEEIKDYLSILKKNSPQDKTPERRKKRNQTSATVIYIISGIN